MKMKKEWSAREKENEGNRNGRGKRFIMKALWKCYKEKVLKKIATRNPYGIDGNEP